MYKNYFSFLIIVISWSCFSQANLSTNGLASNSNSAVSLFSGLKVVEYGRDTYEGETDVQGSPYLFKSWNNHSKVWSGDTVLSIDSINYNLRDERFEIKINEDSIFIISPDNNIRKIVIGTFKFKPYHDTELNTDLFYEVLWEDSNYSLLSKYTLKIKGGSIDPLTKSYVTPKEYTSEKEFFIIIHKSKDQMTGIKLKKSDILKLIETSYIDEVKKFVKNQKLKYKDISDVQKILTHYYSISS